MALISRKEVTVPNILTLLRILMACIAAFLIGNERYQAFAASMLIVASILDYFDGWYARKFKQTTRLGAHLDPFADKVLIAVIFVSLSLRFNWSWFYYFVVIILIREIAITVYRMIVRRRSGEFVPASRLGKIKTTIQCIVGDALLFYIFIMPGKLPPRSWEIFSVMALTMCVTVDSGLRYLLPSCPDGKKRSVIERLVQWVLSPWAREA